MIILASASATRRQLIENAGLSVSVVPAAIDERALGKNISAGQKLAQKLAVAKAEQVAGEHPDALVIGADQTLVHGGSLLHKPESLDHARQQLLSLRGRTHELHAAVSLARNGKSLWSHADSARLTMRAFSEADLDRVIKAEGEALLGSVGAYRLEGASIQLFDAIEGDYFTILGLPLLPLLNALRQQGIAA